MPSRPALLTALFSAVVLALPSAAAASGTGGKKPEADPVQGAYETVSGFVRQDVRWNASATSDFSDGCHQWQDDDHGETHASFTVHPGDEVDFSKNGLVVTGTTFGTLGTIAQSYGRTESVLTPVEHYSGCTESETRAQPDTSGCGTFQLPLDYSLSLGTFPVGGQYRFGLQETSLIQAAQGLFGQGCPSDDTWSSLAVPSPAVQAVPDFKKAKKVTLSGTSTTTDLATSISPPGTSLLPGASSTATVTWSITLRRTGDHATKAPTPGLGNPADPSKGASSKPKGSGHGRHHHSHKRKHHKAPRAS